MCVCVCFICTCVYFIFLSNDCIQRRTMTIDYMLHQTCNGVIGKGGGETDAKGVFILYAIFCGHPK